MNERLFDEEAERQDRRAMESLNKLDNYLNNLEDDDVKIRDLINQLEKIKSEYEAPDEDLDETPNEDLYLDETSGENLESDENQGENQKGWQKTKGRHGSNNRNYAPVDNMAEEVGSSFISCFILCTVTALIGTGWFLYIINHI